MNYLICQLLNDEEIKIIKNQLNINKNDWEDGKKTAGSHAAKLKHNFYKN